MSNNHFRYYVITSWVLRLELALSMSSVVMYQCTLQLDSVAQISRQQKSGHMAIAAEYYLKVFKYYV